jgi:hypothetical protein
MSARRSTVVSLACRLTSASYVNGITATVWTQSVAGPTASATPSSRARSRSTPTASS